MAELELFLDDMVEEAQGGVRLKHGAGATSSRYQG